MFENIENMIYNNVDFDDKFNNGDDDYFIINDVKGRGEYSENLSTIRVTGLDGVIIGGQQASEQYIEIHFTIKSPSYDSLHKKLESLLDTLYSEEDVPITFSDENGRTYFGQFREIVRSYEGSKIFKGIIYILRADPYKYGEEKTVNFESDTVIAENQGTAPADPIFELEVKEPTTFAMVSNGDEYMMVGQPVNADDIVFNRDELILHEDCSSTVGWTTATEVEGGIVDGTMVSDGSSFIATDYGSGSGWHGPSLKTSLSEPLTNFRAEFLIEQVGIYGREVGNVEIFLLDVNSQVVGSIRMRDSNTGIRLNEANARAGSFENGRLLIANDYGNRHDTWINFNGMLRLQRANNRWQAYVALIDSNGNHHSTMTRPFEDFEGLYSADIAQIQVYIATSKDYEPTQQKINDIKVYKLNQREGVPYIAYPGDNIRFDHQTGDCYINGEPVPFDFGGDFFKLRKGYNTLAVQPENTFNTSLKYRERYR